MGSTFPLAIALAENILEAHGIASQEALHAFSAIINFGSTLQKLADATVTIAVEQTFKQVGLQSPTAICILRGALGFVAQSTKLPVAPKNYAGQLQLI